MRRHSLFPFRRGHDPPIARGEDQREFLVQPASRNQLVLGGILVSICLGALLVTGSGQTAILQKGANQRGGVQAVGTVMVTPMTCGRPSEVFTQFGFSASQVPDRTRLLPLPRPGQTQGAQLIYDPATDQLCTQGGEPLSTRFGVTPPNGPGSNTATTTSSTPSWLPGSAWVQGVLNDLWQSASSGFSKLLTDIIDWATTFGFLFVTPKNLTYGQPVVKSLYSWVLGLLDTLVSLILVVWGYSYMIGRAGDFRQSAIRLIVAAVAANVSLFFFEQIIEAHNALCLGLQAALLSAGVHLSFPADLLKVQGAAVYAVIAYLSELLLAVLLSLQLLARIALLDLLIIVAPLGLVCFALPQTQAWQSLSEAVPSPLREVWQPMSREAVPPDLLAPRKLPLGLFTQEMPTSSRSIVRGHFARRAAEPPPTASIPRIQKERELAAWIGLRLTRTQQEILLHVYAHPLLAPYELATLLDMQTETLLRALAPLRQWGCLQRCATEMGERLVLGARGIRLLAAQHAVAVTHLAESRQQVTDPLIQRGVPYMQRTIRHTAGIYRFVVQLTQAARERGHQLLWWETGARCARRYRYQGAWHNLLPDARLVYQTETETIHLWLEWDEGTMRQRSLAAKLHTYEQYIKTRQWRQDEAVIPFLLIVVPDPGQEQRLCHLAATLLHDTPLHVYVTTASRLERDGPLASIWIWFSNKRQESDKTRHTWVQGERTEP